MNRSREASHRSGEMGPVQLFQLRLGWVGPTANKEEVSRLEIFLVHLPGPLRKLGYGETNAEQQAPLWFEVT